MRRSHPVVALLAVVFTGLGMGSSLAAEEIFFRWQAASRSLLVTDLETYAATGVASSQLQSYFNSFSNARGLNALRTILNQTVQVNFVSFERFLRSDAGDCMLDHASSVLIPSPGSTAGKISLRAALVNAASPDGDFNLLELMTAYPTPQMHFDLDEVARDNANHLDPALKDDLREFWQKGGLPKEQLQQLQAQVFSEETPSNLQTLNFMDIDYDLLSDITLRICEKLDQPST